MKNQEMTIKLANSVRAIYEANKGEGMDRGSYVSMLMSNLEHTERTDHTMLYQCGDLSPDTLAELKAYWTSLDKGERGQEYMAICELVNAQDWD